MQKLSSSYSLSKGCKVVRSAATMVHMQGVDFAPVLFEVHGYRNKYVLILILSEKVRIAKCESFVQQHLSIGHAPEWLLKGPEKVREHQN